MQTSGLATKSLMASAPNVEHPPTTRKLCGDAVILTKNARRVGTRSVMVAAEVYDTLSRRTI